MYNSKVLRFNHYATDGTGRDSYISTTNGGLAVDKRSSAAPRFGTIPTFGRKQDSLSPVRQAIP